MPAVASDQAEPLLFERPEEGVLLVTLNRPEVLNAMTYRMHTELSQLWADIERDSETRVVVVTGAGRGFSAGNDLRQPAPSTEQAPEVADRVLQLVYGMVQLEKPIVAAINGVAVGAGLAVALTADITIAAEDAKLIDGQTRVGVASGEHACLSWPLLCGLAKAKYYLLTNEPLTGAEAERIGLVSLALPAEQVLPKALEVAAGLARGSQPAIRWTKRALNHWLRQAAPIFELSSTLEILGFFGADVDEARRAFREKREPDFPSARTS